MAPRPVHGVRSLNDTAAICGLAITDRRSGGASNTPITRYPENVTCKKCLRKLRSGVQLR